MLTNQSKYFRERCILTENNMNQIQFHIQEHQIYSFLVQPTDYDTLQMFFLCDLPDIFREYFIGLTQSDDKPIDLIRYFVHQFQNIKQSDARTFWNCLNRVSDWQLAQGVEVLHELSVLMINCCAQFDIALEKDKNIPRLVALTILNILNSRMYDDHEKTSAIISVLNQLKKANVECLAIINCQLGRCQGRDFSDRLLEGLSFVDDSDTPTRFQFFQKICHYLGNQQLTADLIRQLNKHKLIDKLMLWYKNPELIAGLVANLLNSNPNNDKDKLSYKIILAAVDSVPLVLFKIQIPQHPYFKRLFWARIQQQDFKDFKTLMKHYYGFILLCDMIYACETDFPAELFLELSHNLVNQHLDSIYKDYKDSLGVNQEYCMGALKILEYRTNRKIFEQQEYD